MERERSIGVRDIEREGEIEKERYTDTYIERERERK